MIPVNLTPGIYLVGRDDGAVEPFFIRVVTSVETHIGSDIPYDSEVWLDPGWWRQKMVVPATMPSDDEWRKIPYLCEEPGA